MRIKSDNPEFDRDMSSMGLINNNVNEYHAYVQRRGDVIESKARGRRQSKKCIRDKDNDISI